MKEINREEFLEWLDEKYPFVQNRIIPLQFALVAIIIILTIIFYINDDSLIDYVHTTLFLVITLGTSYITNRYIMNGYIQEYRNRN